MKSLNSKKRILILGDSLCLPRNQPEIVAFYQAWPHLLKKNEQFEIIQIAIGGGTIRNLYEQSFYYAAYEPDFVIIQSGIVDCAPRALGWLEKEIINRCHLLEFIFYHFFPINSMRKYRKITYTKPTYFKSLIKQFADRFQNSQLIWIGIIPASNEYEKNVTGITKNIIYFNSIIKTEIESNYGIFLNTDTIPNEGIMSDYHHLNSIGHEWIYKHISIILSSKDH